MQFKYKSQNGKMIKMPKTRKEFLEEQLKAIDKSIKKWECIVYQKQSEYGSSDCACCQMFCCMYCPIAQYVGENSCLGTPYEDWDDYTFDIGVNKITDKLSRILANKELVFLFEVQRWLVLKLYHNKKHYKFVL